MKCWKDFNGLKWRNSVDVRDFIQNNYTEYRGDDNFLSSPTRRTLNLWNKVEKMIQEEIKTGKFKIDTTKFSGINN